jgi:ADP-ribose pyrophosphatase YjhB (NUDIX family)
MELQIGVKILFKNGAGKYLLLKRSPKKYPDVKDGWDAVGGRIKAGETLLNGLKREIKEEIFQTVNLKNRLKLIAAQDILRPPKTHVVRLTYTTDLKIKNSLKLSAEAIGYKWFSLNEMKKLKNLDKYVKELVVTNKLK